MNGCFPKTGMKRSRARPAGKDSARLGVVIAAAGLSSRMNGIDKQLLELAGVPVVIRALQAFDGLPQVSEQVLVCRQQEIAGMWELLRRFEIQKVSQIVAGGGSRQESVFAGVRSLGTCEYIAVHDGARAFISPQVIIDCLALAKEHRAALAAVPVKDTIKCADSEGYAAGTPPRESLYIAQTPQIFERALYLTAMAQAEKEGRQYTDDCQLVEALGGRCFLSPGSYLNFKITTPEDLIMAQAIAEGEID